MKCQSLYDLFIDLDSHRTFSTERFAVAPSSLPHTQSTFSYTPELVRTDRLLAASVLLLTSSDA